MRGCLKIFGILLGVFLVLGAIFALVFWLDWRRSNQLQNQARHEYYAGNATAALDAYQKYIKCFSLVDDDEKQAKRYIAELEEVLNAARLQQEGQVEEAVNAYQAYLEAHSYYKSSSIPYYFQAHKALASLKPQQAQQVHALGEFAAALEIYRSILTQEPIIDGECRDDNQFCQEALAAIEASRAEALAAVPNVILNWYQSLGADGNYPEFTKSCDSLLKSYSEILHTPDGEAARAAVDKGLEELPNWYASHPAEPVIEYATEVVRDQSDRWAWITYFLENGGLVSYTVKGTGWIIDAQGEKWVSVGSTDINRGKVTVPAGGKAEDSYWCEGDAFANGFAYFTWTGEDEYGNPITLEEKVHLLP
jgi:hypothetical protein